MLIEATEKPIRYRLRTGEEVVLTPGVPVELPDQAARQLLKQAGEKVRRVPIDRTGQVVTWNSPLFGVLNATVLEDLAHSIRVIHPLTDVDCLIPTAWVELEWNPMNGRDKEAIPEARTVTSCTRAPWTS